MNRNQIRIRYVNNFLTSTTSSSMTGVTSSMTSGLSVDGLVTQEAALIFLIFFLNFFAALASVLT